MLNAEQESNIDRLLKESPSIIAELAKQEHRFTLLMLEAIGPAPYVQRLGNDEDEEGKDLHTDLCAEIIGEFQGTILNSIGDALIAVFQESAAAAGTGAKIQRRLAYINQYLPEDERVELRIAIHSGGKPRPDLDISAAVATVAEVAKESGPAQILISSSTLAEFVLDKDLRSNWYGKLKADSGFRTEDLFEILWTDSATYKELRAQVTALLAQGKLVCPGLRATEVLETAAATTPEEDQGDATVTEPPSSPWPVTLPQRYEIMQELGRGGMGVVYKALDRETAEIMAVKVLKPEIAGDPAGMERFKNELRLARRVTHKNVCRIYDFNRIGNTAFITMEFVDGVTLHDYVHQSGHLSPDEGIHIVRQICTALQAAHHQGIIHRDLKPSNIMIDRDGNIKIMDFGIARSLDGSVTVTGMVLGTPSYMAPEQAEGRVVDTRTDIYLLGLILYEVFTGIVAFSGDTPFLIALKQMRESPRPLRSIEPKLPDHLEQVVMRCLEKRPDLRFQSVEELESALTTEPPASVSVP